MQHHKKDVKISFDFALIMPSIGFNRFCDVMPKSMTLCSAHEMTCSFVAPIRTKELCTEYRNVIKMGSLTRGLRFTVF